MFPLISALVLLAFFGFVFGIIMLFIKQLRHYSAYLVLSTALASMFSFCLFWGGGLLIEKLFGPTRWSTLSAFIGYVGGLLLGAVLGLFLAQRINAKFIRNNHDKAREI